MNKLFLILILITPVSAFEMPSPDSYGHNECELIAKDLMKAHSNTNIVFILPLTDSGAYNMGDYSGHFINSISTHTHTLY